MRRRAHRPAARSQQSCTSHNSCARTHSCIHSPPLPVAAWRADYWLKLHNRLGKELLLQRRDAASGLAETVATIPQAAGNVHFEYLGTPGEALQVVSRDGSYTRKLKNVKPSDEGRAAVIELKERGQASRIPTGMKRRAIFDDVVTPADKDEL